MDSVPPMILGEVMRLGKLCTQLDEVMIIEATEQRKTCRIRGHGKTMGKTGDEVENHRKTIGKPMGKT